MKLLSRILVTVIAAIAVIFVLLNWVAPVALSFYAAKQAPSITRIVPQALKNNSVSGAPGTNLSYCGYDFEVPWTDVDDRLTTLSPQGSPVKNRVDLHFLSGLRLVLTAVPPREWSRGVAKEMKVSPEAVEEVFGPGSSSSDYAFVKALYEFTPERMNHWTTSNTLWSRDQMLLITKSIALLKAAESGIFTLQNQSYRGFQEGNPEVRQDGIAVHLFSEDGSVEILLFQKDYKNPTGVTQQEIQEINRIVQSLRKATQVVRRTPPQPAKNRSQSRAAPSETSPAFDEEVAKHR